MSQKVTPKEDNFIGSHLTPMEMEALTTLREHNVQKITDDFLEIVFYAATDGWIPGECFPGLYDLYMFLRAVGLSKESSPVEIR